MLVNHLQVFHPKHSISVSSSLLQNHRRRIHPPPPPHSGRHDLQMLSGMLLMIPKQQQEVMCPIMQLIIFYTIAISVLRIVNTYSLYKRHFFFTEQYLSSSGLSICWEIC